MSFVIADPEMMTSAASDMATIGDNLSAAHTAAATQTTAVLPAAADEVSDSIAHLFSAHAQQYQALAGRAAAFQEQFVQHLTASARSFAHAEAANTSLLQPLAATADSIGSLLFGAFWDQLVYMFNDAVAQLGNSRLLNNILAAVFIVLPLVFFYLLFQLLALLYNLFHS
jgi:hypothetical protein